MSPANIRKLALLPGEWIALLQDYRARRDQKTFIYCTCGNELCSSGSFVSDTYDDHGDNHVQYKCSRCGKESDFNFDVAPIPINWNELKRSATT